MNGIRLSADFKKHIDTAFFKAYPDFAYLFDEATLGLGDCLLTSQNCKKAASDFFWYHSDGGGKESDFSVSKELKKTASVSKQQRNDVSFDNNNHLVYSGSAVEVTNQSAFSHLATINGEGDDATRKVDKFKDLLDAVHDLVWQSQSQQGRTRPTDQEPAFLYCTDLGRYCRDLARQNKSVIDTTGKVYTYESTLQGYQNEEEQADFVEAWKVSAGLKTGQYLSSDSLPNNKEEEDTGTSDHSIDGKGEMTQVDFDQYNSIYGKRATGQDGDMDNAWVKFHKSHSAEDIVDVFDDSVSELRLLPGNVLRLRKPSRTTGGRFEGLYQDEDKPAGYTISPKTFNRLINSNVISLQNDKAEGETDVLEYEIKSDYSVPYQRYFPNFVSEIRSGSAEADTSEPDTVVTLPTKFTAWRPPSQDNAGRYQLLDTHGEATGTTVSQSEFVSMAQTAGKGAVTVDAGEEGVVTVDAWEKLKVNAQVYTPGKMNDDGTWSPATDIIDDGDDGRSGGGGGGGGRHQQKDKILHPYDTDATPGGRDGGVGGGKGEGEGGSRGGGSGGGGSGGSVSSAPNVGVAEDVGLFA